MANEFTNALIEAWKAHQLGNQSAAIEGFSRVLQVDPDNEEGLNGLGLAQKASGDILGARATFMKLQKIAEQKLQDDPSSRYQMEVRMIKQQLTQLEKMG